MGTQQTQKQYKLTARVFTLISMMVLFASCAKNGAFQVADGINGTTNSSSSNSAAGIVPADPVMPITPPATTPIATPIAVPGGSTFTVGYKPESLSWESAAHPERKAWSSSAYDIVAKNLSALDQARDIEAFCPQYNSLTSDQRINLWADLFASTAYYECAWDPASNSVDVGTTSNTDSWSVGLLQLSVIDQQSYGLSLGYNFKDLQDPTKNLNLGVAIMARQVKKYGEVLIPVGSPGLYWATLHPGGKYDSSSSIESMTKKLSFCH